MEGLYLIISMGVLALLTAYWRVSLRVFTASAATLLLALSAWTCVSAAWMAPAWIIFIAVIVPLNLSFIRRKLISDRLYSLAGKTMPSMSKTEREALEAGSVWWDAELFSGRPRWKRLLSFPAPKLKIREQKFIDGPVEELCGMLDDWRITEELADLPPEVWSFIKEKGFFGMIIPKKYGGLEFSALAHSAVITRIAGRSITAAVTIMVPNSLGPAELILNYGTKEQKERYLPSLAKGREVPCFALTGPEAGSDAASMPDTGVVCVGEYGNKKDVLGIKLNWEKRYITLGPVASVLGLAFKLFDPEHLIGDTEKIGITLALIPTNTPNVIIGSRHFPLNSAFQVGPTWGNDVFIPLDYIIGGQEMAGQGWKMLMDCLSVGRSVSLPALSAGSSKLAARVIGAYTRVRKQFKLPIGRLEGVEEGMARIAGNTYLIDAARTLTTTGVDLGEKPSVISALVKYSLTELARKVVNHAMDIQGGAAICMGPRNLLARIYQTIPISITVEGSNTLTRNMIAFGQGAIRCHPFLFKEMEAIGNTNREAGKADFDRALWGHIGFGISNAVRSLFLGLTGSMIATVPGSRLTRPYFRDLTRMSAAFALAADVSIITLGGTLKRKERLSARLADIFSSLYLTSAALKRFHDQGCPREDLPFVRWASEESLHIIEARLDAFLKNFPNPVLSNLVRFLVFPLGRSFAPPGDRLDHKVADLLFSPGAARDRLTEGIFLPSDINEPLGRLEDALQKSVVAEPLEKKMRQAEREGLIKGGLDKEGIEEAVDVGVLDQEEATVLTLSIEAMREVIRVDDFPQKV